MFDESFEEFAEFEDALANEFEAPARFDFNGEAEAFEEFSESEEYEGATARPLLLGLDTASVAGNKNPNWAKAKSHGKIRFAIIRGAWGATPDKVFARDWPKAEMRLKGTSAILSRMAKLPEESGAPEKLAG